MSSLIKDESLRLSEWPVMSLSTSLLKASLVSVFVSSLGRKKKLILCAFSVFSCAAFRAFSLVFVFPEGFCDALQ